MEGTPGRPAALALGASAWALLLLPGQLTVWSSGGPRWMRAIGESAPYEGVRAVAAALRVDDYVVFGAPIALSFLLLALALRPLARSLGWAARLLFWLTLAGSVIVVVSYVASGWPRPWRYVWGSEVFVLALMGFAAILTAIVAAARRVRPVIAVVLLGLLLPVEIIGTLVFEYWPHGSLVFVGPWLAAILWLLVPGRPLQPDGEDDLPQIDGQSARKREFPARRLRDVENTARMSPGTATLSACATPSPFQNP